MSKSNIGNLINLSGRRIFVSRDLIVLHLYKTLALKGKNLKFVTMYIKIYFGDKPVFLCDSINKELEQILHHPDAIFVDEINTHAINALLHEIKKDNFHAGVLLHNNLGELEEAFLKHFTHIEAAGGIVYNEKGELLMIYRLEKWDLPKGKL